MPSFAEVKDEISKVVRDSNGLKTTEILDRLPKEMYIFDIPSIIEEMLDANRLVALSVSIDKKHRVFLHSDWGKHDGQST